MQSQITIGHKKLWYQINVPVSAPSHAFWWSTIVFKESIELQDNIEKQFSHFSK